MRLARHPALAAVVVGLLAAGCGSASGGSAPTLPAATVPVTTTAPSATTPSTVAATTSTTAVYVPASPQDSADGAAAALLEAWGDGNRASAAAVASPAAVSALFAVPSRALQFRGCSDGTPPLTCTYADRSSAAGTLYEIDAAQTAAGGWYVTSVAIEE